jgi:aspartyl-tRNA(Asn)/glutamyl-tRNA(Gln) amidotransferase subunit A
LLLQCIAGKDPHDPTTRDTPHPLRIPEDTSVKTKIAVPEEFLGDGVNPQVKAVIQKCIGDFESLGAKIEYITMPDLKYALPAYYIIAMAEASSNLARFDGIRYGPKTNVDSDDTFFDFIAKFRAKLFGEEVKKRILIGSFTLSSGYYDQYYAKAMKVRKLITDHFTKIFKKFDLILGPTVPNLPFKLDEELEDPLALYLCDIFTVPVNLAGLPAISFPCGSNNNLPIGAQLIAPEFQENRLFNAVHAYQNISGHHERAPAKFVREDLI